MLDSIVAASEPAIDYYNLLTEIEDLSRVEQIKILTLGATWIKVHFADSKDFGEEDAVVVAAAEPEPAVASSILHWKQVGVQFATAAVPVPIDSELYCTEFEEEVVAAASEAVGWSIHVDLNSDC